MNKCPNCGSGYILTPWVTPPRIVALNTILVLTTPSLTLQTSPLPSVPASLRIAHVTSLLGLNVLSNLAHRSGTQSLPLAPVNLVFLSLFSLRKLATSFFGLLGSNPQSSSCLSNPHQTIDKSVSSTSRCVQNSPSCHHLHGSSPVQAVPCLVPGTAFQLVSGCLPLPAVAWSQSSQCPCQTPTSCPVPHSPDKA